MRKKRIILVKDPKLRKVRYKLRLLLVREVNKRMINKINEKGDLRQSIEFDCEKHD